MKRKACFVLAALLTASLSLGVMRVSAQEVEVTHLPILNEENQEEIIAQRKEETINEETVVPMLWQGFLEMDITVGEKTRTAKVYIPENLPMGSLCVFMNVPEGEEAIDFIQKSGWVERADKERIWLLIAEPEGDSWGTPEEERDYIKAAFSAHRGQIYFRGNLSIYTVGYGPIGAEVQRIAMADPLYCNGGVFLDASEIEASALEEYQAMTTDTDTKKFGVDYKDIPVPIWVSNAEETEENQAVADYWKSAAKVGADPVQDETYGDIYTQAEQNMFTPEGAFVQVAVQNAAYDYASPDTTKAICDFLLQYFRCGAGGPWANMISHKINYEEMGVDFYLYTQDNGTRREYMVYVPEDLKNSEEPLPLVINFHGAKSSMRNAFEESMWYKLAEEKGFIIAMPESGFVGKGIAWNLDEGDASFVMYVTRRICNDYPVDESRIYYTGHSMGIFLANYALMGEASDCFAAIGGTSSGKYVESLTGSDSVIPFYLSMGEYDLWQVDLEADDVPQAALDQWLIRDGLATEENVKEVRTSGMTEEKEDGRYTSYTWANADGVPLVQYTVVAGKDHMNTYEENRILWDELFSKWQLGEDGVRLYEGNPVTK